MLVESTGPVYIIAKLCIKIGWLGVCSLAAYVQVVNDGETENFRLGRTFSVHSLNLILIRDPGRS